MHAIAPSLPNIADPAPDFTLYTSVAAYQYAGLLTEIPNNTNMQTVCMMIFVMKLSVCYSIILQTNSVHNGRPWAENKLTKTVSVSRIIIKIF